VANRRIYVSPGGELELYETPESYILKHVAQQTIRLYGKHANIAALISGVRGIPTNWATPEFYEALNKWLVINWPYYMAVYFHDSAHVPKEVLREWRSKA
jgi:hypothetical protein